MQLTNLDLILWALSLAVHCILFTVLLVRRRAAIFPIFTTWIASNIARTIILYFTLHHGSSEQYFYAYWTLAIVDVVLQAAVAYELARHVFQPLGVWAQDIRRSFLALTIASVLVAAALTWLATPATRTIRLAIVIRGNFFTSALMTELFVAMIALSVTVGLPWRTHTARLAQGLGVYSILGIVIAAAHSYLGTAQGNQAYKLLSHFRIELYLFCVGYWIVTLMQQEPETRKLPEQLHEELRELQRRAGLVLQSLRVTGSAS